MEWPKAVSCTFEDEYLAVPQEALVATMEANQKFFPVLDGAGRLTARFIGIANVEPADDSLIRSGYERVIRPRFADARFFFVEDMKQGLASMNAGLASVTYQAKLGTVADKVARVAALAEAIAPQVGVDAALAKRAASLSKADLQSRLVNEFPELQGIAGRHYAMQDAALSDLTHADREAVANAIDEAWQPLFERFDHRTLNDVPGLENSTCENLAAYIWDALKPRVATLSAITVWETSDACCTYRGPTSV